MAGKNEMPVDTESAKCAPKFWAEKNWKAGIQQLHIVVVFYKCKLFLFYGICFFKPFWAKI
jgi:hypothetical protein